MKLEFTSNLFKLSDEKNQGDETQSTDPQHVYSEEKYGSVQAFVTKKKHKEAYGDFKKEFEAEIDRVIEFAKAHIKAEGDDSNAPSLSPAQEKEIRENSEEFKRGLFTFNEKGKNETYDSQASLVYSTGKSTFFAFSKLMNNDKVPLQERLNALENVGKKLKVCAGGVVDAIDDEVIMLKAALHGVTGLISKLTQEIARQEILEFARRRHKASAYFYPAMEVHFVNYYFNQLAAHFAWPPKDDPYYANERSTNIKTKDLKDCYAILNEKIRPSRIVRLASESYLQEIKNSVGNPPSAQNAGDDIQNDEAIDPEQQFQNYVDRAQKRLAAQYEDMPRYCVVDTDEDTYQSKWQSTSTLGAVTMLRNLKKKNAVDGDGERILASAMQSDDEKLELMQWERLFWGNQKVREDESKPWLDPDLFVLRTKHLESFSPQDISVASGEDRDHVLKNIVLEAIAGAEMEEVLAIPDAWLPHVSLAEMLQASQLDDPMRQANVEQWTTLFKKAIDSGASIEKPNDAGETPLQAAAGQGLVNACIALIDTGANLKVRNDVDGNNVLMVLIKGLRSDVDVKQWGDLLGCLIAKKANILKERNKKKQTPLFMAAQCGRFNAFVALIDKGADLRAQDAGKRHALQLCLAEGYDDMGRVFVERMQSSHRRDLLKFLKTEDKSKYDLTRYLAFKNNCPKTIEAIDAFLVQGMRNKSLEKKNFKKIVRAKGKWWLDASARYVALSLDRGSAISSDNALLKRAMKEGWLNNKEFKEIVACTKWTSGHVYGRISGRLAALGGNHVAAIAGDNELLIHAMEKGWLTPKDFKEIVAAKNKVGGFSSTEERISGRYLALENGSVGAIRMDNDLLIKARKEQWLSNEDLFKILYEGIFKIKDTIEGFKFQRFPYSDDGQKADLQKTALLAHGEAVLKAYENGWLTQENLQVLEPERDWLENTFPEKYKEAQANQQRLVSEPQEYRSPRPKSGWMDCFTGAGYKQTEQQALQADVDVASNRFQQNSPPSEEITATESTEISMPPPQTVNVETKTVQSDVTSPENTLAEPQPVARHSIAAQGAFAAEMHRFGHELPFYDERTELTIDERIDKLNDCGLQALFRVDRNLQEAYLNRGMDPEGWKKSLDCLRDQLVQTAEMDGISEEGIMGDHLERLFKARGIEYESSNALTAEAAERGLSKVLQEGYKEGKTFVLITGNSRGDNDEDHSVTMGSYPIVANHFVTLVPPCKPDEVPNQSLSENPDQQIWRLSDSHPNSSEEPARYVPVTTQQIVQGIQNNCALLCIPNAPTHHEQIEQVKRMGREVQEGRGEAEAKPSSSTTCHPIDEVISPESPRLTMKEKIEKILGNLDDEDKQRFGEKYKSEFEKDFDPAHENRFVVNPVPNTKIASPPYFVDKANNSYHRVGDQIFVVSLKQRGGQKAEEGKGPTNVIIPDPKKTSLEEAPAHSGDREHRIRRS